MANGVKIAVKNLRFNAGYIAREVGKANARNMLKASAFLRRRARSSMRRRKKPAPIGSPPSAHDGNLKNIQFAYDPSTKSSVIGPMPFPSSRVTSSLTGAGLQERGGRAVIHSQKRRSGQLVRVSQPAVFGAHPFMGPAMTAEAPRFPSLWFNSVGGA